MLTEAQIDQYIAEADHEYDFSDCYFEYSPFQFDLQLNKIYVKDDLDLWCKILKEIHDTPTRGHVMLILYLYVLTLVLVSYCVACFHICVLPDHFTCLLDLAII